MGILEPAFAMDIPAVVRKLRQPLFTADLRRGVARIVAENPDQVNHHVDAIGAIPWCWQQR
ncbi:MAG TPA: hypothetical protein DHV85_02270 [Candidatus Accumulibacter sp.]|nr:hypothetical protein [Accumulibacter sp.]